MPTVGGGIPVNHTLLRPHMHMSIIRFLFLSLCLEAVASRFVRNKQEAQVKNTREAPLVIDSIDGNTLAPLEWGVPTGRFSLQKDTVVEWVIEDVKAFAELQCTLDLHWSTAGRVERGDVDLAIYFDPTTILCKSAGPTYQEECTTVPANWNDLPNVTVALAAFDDIDDLVLICTQTQIPVIALDDVSDFFLVESFSNDVGITGRWVYLDLSASNASSSASESPSVAESRQSNSSKDTTRIACGYNFHFFDGPVRGHGGVAWTAYAHNATDSEWIGRGGACSISRLPFPTFSVPPGMDGVFVQLTTNSCGNGQPPNKRLSVNCSSTLPS